MAQTQKNKTAGKPATQKTAKETAPKILEAGTLYIVATPIGNSLDWTERAKMVLAEADMVAAEDTRLLKRELAKISVEIKKVVTHHNHNEEASTKGLIETLLKGGTVALASDAGTPLVSDPGYRLVAAAREKKIRVVPVPGCSSLTAALSTSALGGKTFFFGGFLATQAETRKRELKRYRRSAENLVFFEAPHRLRELLADAEEILGGNTPTVVCRELTKPYEEIIQNSLTEVKNYFRVNEPRGEFVVIFKGTPLEQLDAKDTESEVVKLLNYGRSASDVLEELQPVTELSRKQLYDIIIRFKKTV